MDSMRIVWAGLVVAAQIQELSPQTIAKRSGVSEKRVRDCLNNPRNLQLETVEKLLEVMDLNLKELCDLGAMTWEFLAQRKLPIPEGDAPSLGGGLVSLTQEIVEVAARVNDANQQLQDLALRVSRLVLAKIDSPRG